MIVAVQVYVLQLSVKNWGVCSDNQTIQFDIPAPRSSGIWFVTTHNSWQWQMQHKWLCKTDLCVRSVDIKAALFTKRTQLSACVPEWRHTSNRSKHHFPKALFWGELQRLEDIGHTHVLQLRASRLCLCLSNQNHQDISKLFTLETPTRSFIQTCRGDSAGANSTGHLSHRGIHNHRTKGQ